MWKTPIGETRHNGLNIKKSPVFADTGDSFFLSGKSH